MKYPSVLLLRYLITSKNSAVKILMQKTGYGVIVNTSFNIRGEPIVCKPEDAYRCFMRTEMDYLVIGNYLFKKSGQPSWDENESWLETYELD